LVLVCTSQGVDVTSPAKAELQKGASKADLQRGASSAKLVAEKTAEKVPLTRFVFNYSFPLACQVDSGRKPTGESGTNIKAQAEAKADTSAHHSPEKQLHPSAHQANHASPPPSVPAVTSIPCMECKKRPAEFWCQVTT
jgi:hypothetical protein